jgi:hypothetical protein
MGIGRQCMRALRGTNLLLGLPFDFHSPTSAGPPADLKLQPRQGVQTGLGTPMMTFPVLSLGNSSFTGLCLVFFTRLVDI